MALLKWDDYATMELIGATIDDIDDPLALTCEFSFQYCLPKRVKLSAPSEDANSILYGESIARYTIDIDSTFFSNTAKSISDQYMDFGIYARLETILIGVNADGSQLYPHAFIKNIYRKGSNHSLGVQRRARERGSREVLDDLIKDKYWEPLLPMKVVLDGTQLDPEKESRGKLSLSFRLLGAIPIGT